METQTRLLVDDSRLDSGYIRGDWHKRGPEGDVYKSHSPQALSEGRVKNPFRHCGMLMVCTGFKYNKDGPRLAEAMKLLTPEQFQGEPTTYREKTLKVMPAEWYKLPENANKNVYAGDYARNDPKGFYHGMQVKHADKTYVICGPIILLEGVQAAAQIDMFA